MRGRAWSEPAFHVFISYRRSDTGPYARNLYDALTQHFGEGSVFFDIDSIAPGRDFVEVLDDTLTKADVLLVLMGPHWADVTDDDGERRLDDPDDYVRLEVETALTDDSVRVIPVLVGGATIPPADALPGSLGALTHRNAASLVDEHWRATMDELIEVLERVRDEVAPATAHGTRGARATGVSSGRRGRGDDASADRARRRKRRTWAIVAGAAALAVLGGAAAVAMSSGGDNSSSAAKPHTTTAPTTVPFKAGDCVTANTKGSTGPQPCSEPHTEEITAVTTFRGGPNDPWPGLDEFQKFADPICAGAFQSYVGVAPGQQSQYKMALLYPTEREWAAGSRGIECAVTTEAGTPTSGSIRGSLK